MYRHSPFPRAVLPVIPGKKETDDLFFILIVTHFARGPRFPYGDELLHRV